MHTFCLPLNAAISFKHTMENLAQFLNNVLAVVWHRSTPEHINREKFLIVISFWFFTLSPSCSYQTETMFSLSRLDI